LNAADFASANRVTDADLSQYLEAVNPGRNVVSIMEYQVDVMRRVLGTDETVGDVLPWKKTHGQFHLTPGETTIWFGINGHGKSAVTGQVALWLALHGSASCIASFEMDPRRTLERMVLQAAGNPDPSVDFMNAFFFGLRKNLWIYDKRGKIDMHYLMAAVRYCADKHHIKHFWIDSLMKCVRASDDRNAEKAFRKRRDGGGEGNRGPHAHHSPQPEAPGRGPSPGQVRRQRGRGNHGPSGQRAVRLEEQGEGTRHGKGYRAGPSPCRTKCPTSS
jgi:hypothetical protein